MSPIPTFPEVYCTERLVLAVPWLYKLKFSSPFPTPRPNCHLSLPPLRYLIPDAYNVAGASSNTIMSPPELVNDGLKVLVPLTWKADAPDPENTSNLDPGTAVP